MHFTLIIKRKKNADWYHTLKKVKKKIIKETRCLCKPNKKNGVGDMRREKKSLILLV